MDSAEPSEGRGPIRYRPGMDTTATTLADRFDERDIKILDSTEELIAEHGYDSVRLIDIADRAGVSVGSLQHRYRTREGLLRAAIERITTRDTFALLHPIEEIADPFARVVALVEHSLTNIDPRQPGWLLWLELTIVAARNDEVREVVGENDAIWRRAFHDAYEDALSQGTIRSRLDAEELASVTVALIDGFVVQDAIDGGTHDTLDRAELVLGVIHRLVDFP